MLTTRLGRRRRRASQLLTTIAATILTVSVAGCAGSTDGHQIATASAHLLGKTRAVAADPGAEARVATSEQEFSLSLLQHLGGGAGNVSVSPASLALVLSMLENGAVGKTRAEISATLHVGDSSLAGQNAGWDALARAWSKSAKQNSIELSSADSAWLQKDSPVRSAFLNALRTYYDAGVWTTDFAKDMPAALRAINSWTSENTHGRITRLFDDLDPSTLLVLANAVYFKAAWQTPFDPADTDDAQFDPATGPAVRTPFLNAARTLPAAVTGTYRAVQLPYTGGRFAALAVMPTKATLTEFTSALTAQRLAQIVGSLTPQQVQVSLPKFTTRTTTGLNSTLAAMGMPTSFTRAADFSAMTPVQVLVSKVIQRVYLRVAEKGTEAAAVSGAAIAPSSAVAPPPTSITIDHPFLFLIRDTTTGAILFASQITDPSAG